MAHLDLWGLPSESAAHIVAELAANATVHGRVSGRDFQLRLSVHPESRLRIEVTDTRDDRLPAVATPDPLAESGRDLVIVEALATRWGIAPGPVPRKTVWAELDLVPTDATGSRMRTTYAATTRLPATRPPTTSKGFKELREITPPNPTPPPS